MKYFMLVFFHGFTWIFSAVKFDDQSITTATEQTITCGITGLSADTTVSWIGPDDNEITGSDVLNYRIDQGNYVLGSKSSSLTITTLKIAALSSGDKFKCKLKSAQYPTYSPEVTEEMTITLLTLGITTCTFTFIFK